MARSLTKQDTTITNYKSALAKRCQDALDEHQYAMWKTMWSNDEDLKSLAARNAAALAAGHIFVVALRAGFPINVLGRIKDVPEVCSIFCATANPAQAVVAESEQGRGVLGVIDGFPPKGVENAEEAEARRAFLRRIGYKR